MGSLSTADHRSNPEAMSHAPATPASLPALRLRRWFAGLSALVIALIAVANAWLVSSFLTEQMFQREAVVARDFVQNVLVSDESLDYLRQPEDPALQQRFRNSLAHLGNMRDLLRANVYGRDRTMLWSSDAKLIGQRFPDNEELEEAMRGELVVSAGRIGADERFKAEHQGLSPSADFFVETYIPVSGAPDGPVLGVVELYKAPLALTEAIHEGRRQVALIALGGAVVLFLTLYWLIVRADRTIRAQQAQLLDARTMAATGELAASVAHNIRNPLASIRSAAELALESPQEHGSESARDILGEVDRISARINELLRLSTPASAERQRVVLPELLRRCVQDHEVTFERRGQILALAADLPPLAAWADAQLLEQVLHSVLDNAAEAMGPGGRCELRLQAAQGQVRLEVADEGPGFTPSQLEQAFRPFFTTKPQGLGLGLTLARRIVERWGGRFELDSAAGRGTTVRIDLPRA